MLLETLSSPGLAHLSYLISDLKSGTAAVIDPRRDVDGYLELAQRHGLRITHVFETHIHADFLSGGLELAERSGATLYGGPSGYRYPLEQPRDGQKLEVGSLTLRVLHTPGHSPEGLCLVVSGGGQGADGEWAVFSGDTLFAGEVGRPDLAALAGTEGIEAEIMARQLHQSLRRLLELPDGLEVYPAHGQGSPCGARIGVRDRTTLGFERAHNPRLKAASEDDFVRELLSELPELPRYYPRMKRLNADGLEWLERRSLPALMPAAVLRELERGAILLDLREIEAYAGAHLEGALSIPLRNEFPVWAGWTLAPENELILLGDGTEAVQQGYTHLLRIGLENVLGFVRGGMRGLLEAGVRWRGSRPLEVFELASELEFGFKGQLLDVRRPDEWASGHLEGATHIPLSQLEARLYELEAQIPTVVYCGSGYRASLACSLLERAGFAEVHNVLGSMSAWTAAGLPLERDPEPG